MAIRQGGKERLLEMHIQISTPLAHTTQEWQRARGKIPTFDGGYSNSAASQKRVDQAREAALARIAEVSNAVAQAATNAYAKNGFPGLTVRAERVGGSVLLRVEGRDAEKYARILENGTKDVDIDGFVRLARRRREVKVTRMDPKTGMRSNTPRGKKTERDGGYYLIVPRVLGVQRRGADGKLEFTGQLAQLSRSGQAALSQFEATPEEADIYANHEDFAVTSEHRTGERATDFEGVRIGGRTYTKLVVKPGMAVGNELFETVKYATKATKAGEWAQQEDEDGNTSFVRDAHGNRMYSRPTQDNPQTLRGGKQRANKRGAELMSRLGVTNLRVNSMDAELGGGPASAQALASRQKGQAVSFITLSTRKGGTIPGREGLHILRDATNALRDALRDEVASARARLGSRTGNFYERAYLETLESAAR